MYRIRGPHWVALCLSALVSISACDRDDGDGDTASDAGDESASEDDADATELAPLTCDELTCEADQVCVEHRAYCDLTGDEPTLRQDPAECRPKDAVPRIAECDGELQGVLAPDPDGVPRLMCPEVEIPCG